MIHILLFLAAVVAGAMNTLAGGGGLVTFPVLMAVVSPVCADATSGFALLPAYVTSTWKSRRELIPLRHWLWLLLGPALLGGLLGALLLVWSGSRAFVDRVPWLLLLATLLILLRSFQIRSAGFRQPPAGKAQRIPPLPAPPLWAAAGALMLLVGVYGGYFGAGIGILAIGALDLMGLRDIHFNVALKNALAAGLRGLAVGVLVGEGKVDWGYGLPMAAGAILGGYLGAALVRWMNRAAVRAVVITIGFAVAAFYFWRVYGAAVLDTTGG
jgi:uncharacterized membrane protein YfcA